MQVNQEKELLLHANKRDQLRHCLIFVPIPPTRLNKQVWDIICQSQYRYSSKTWLSEIQKKWNGKEVSKIVILSNRLDQETYSSFGLNEENLADILRVGSISRWWGGFFCMYNLETSLKKRGLFNSLPINWNPISAIMPYMGSPLQFTLALTLQTVYIGIVALG